MVGCFKPPTLWMNRRCLSCKSLPCSGRTCWGPINPCQVGTAEKKSWWSLKTLKTLKLHRIAKWSEIFFLSFGWFFLTKSYSDNPIWSARCRSMCNLCSRYTANPLDSNLTDPSLVTTYNWFHSIPFHSIPFHSIPFHSIPFHSMPLRILI